MDFKELLAKALEAVTDEKSRAELQNAIELLHTKDVAGIKQNRDELINEKKNIKIKLDEATESLKTLDGKTLADFQQLENDIAELRANPGDKEKFKQLEEGFNLKFKLQEETNIANLKRENEKLAEANGLITKLNRKMNDTTAHSALSSALDAIGVKKEFKATLVKALASDVYVEEVGEERIVKFKHDGIPFEINDGLETWGREKGNKVYLSALNNRGAGAPGSRGAGGVIKPFAEMTISERNDLFRKDPELYKQMKEGK